MKTNNKYLIANDTLFNMMLGFSDLGYCLLYSYINNLIIMYSIFGMLKIGRYQLGIFYNVSYYNYTVVKISNFLEYEITQ